MDIKKVTEAEAQYIKKMFGEPCHSKSQQSVRLINMLGKQPKLQPLNESKSFFVSDDVNMKQLVQKWYNIQFKNKQNKKKPEDYMLMYEKDQTKISLHDNQNFMDLKSKLQCQTFLEELTLMVYEQQFCPDYTNQCYSEQSYRKFEEKHNKSIQIPVKVMIDPKPAYYFYINKLSPEINFKQLKVQIQRQLKSNIHPVKCAKDVAYTLWIQKQAISNLIQQKINCFEQIKGQLYKNNKLTIGPKLQKSKVRQFCSPGQIINVRFTNNSFKYESSPAAKDCLIQIKCYTKSQKDKDKKQNSDKIQKLSIQKKTIQRNFSQISKMKVSTLLKQENVQNPFVMSLYLDGEIFRPSIKFQEIGQINKLIDKKGPIIFVSIPDNFLYYQQISELANENTMQDLLREIPKSKILPVKIYDESKKQFTTQKTLRLDKLRNTKGLRQEHKNPNFLDPIMVYTTDMICYKLNSFLRQTSIALFDKQKIRDQYWPYKTSQKIIQNLLKLENYIGTVYRGSQMLSFECQKGEVLEWAGFTSTSKKLNAAEQFIEYLTMDTFIFQIKTFTGKQIGKFSITPNQFEILLLPYTKFKVLDVQKKLNYTYVKMLQLPVPKKIPGNIVVWIDNNFKQNTLYYNMLVRDYELKNFDLIQLESNEHLITWLNEFKYIHDLPQLKLHFITNMNRSAKIAGKVPQGIQTLKIIRNFSESAKVVFFIEGIKQKWNQLKKAGKEKDANILVIEDPSLLMKHLLENSLKN